MEGDDLVCNFKKCRKRLTSVAYVREVHNIIYVYVLAWNDTQNYLNMYKMWQMLASATHFQFHFAVDIFGPERYIHSTIVHAFNFIIEQCKPLYYSVSIKILTW